MANLNDQMAPDASPGEVSGKSGIRRVNNRPLYILGSLVALFLLIMVMVAMDRAANQNAQNRGKKNSTGSTALFAKELAGNRTGIIAMASPPVIPKLKSLDESHIVPVALAQSQNLNVPPRPPGSNQQHPEKDPESERIRLAKMQMMIEAIQSKTGVQIIAPRSSGSLPGRANSRAPKTRQEMLAAMASIRQKINTVQTEDPTKAYQARLEQIRSMTGVSSNIETGEDKADATSVSPSQLAQTSPGTNGGDDPWKLETQMEAPRTHYELRAGFVIPGTLISGINSSLPGQIIAQVSKNVYDTPTGQHLLIPQGSRLVGNYSSKVAYGQSRILITWQRIVFPDGKALDIGSMPGSDSAGYSGFNDQADNHYLRTFGSAILMSAVIAGVNLSQDRATSNEPFGNSQRASDAMSEALGQQLGQVMSQMIGKNLNIAPTLNIRPGFRFNVVVTKDLAFTKPYKAFDY